MGLRSSRILFQLSEKFVISFFVSQIFRSFHSHSTISELYGADKLTNFLQSYISSEVNLHHEGSCTHTCGFYEKTKHFNNAADDLHKCAGLMRRCETIDNNRINVCQAASSGERKFDYIKFSDERTMGKPQDWSDRSCAKQFKVTALKMPSLFVSLVDSPTG